MKYLNQQFQWIKIYAVDWRRYGLLVVLWEVLNWIQKLTVWIHINYLPTIENASINVCMEKEINTWCKILSQNKCFTFTIISCDIRSLNTLPANPRHRITCEMLRLLGGKCNCTENPTTLSSSDLQTATEILYIKACSFL
jgi:hypothetical protein